jgi:hypothetical protein
MSNQILKVIIRPSEMGWKKLFFNPLLDSPGEKKNSNYNIKGGIAIK